MIDACLKMNHTGINQGTAGNLSVRWKNGLLITPSGVPYDEMTVDDIVFMTWTAIISTGSPPRRNGVFIAIFCKRAGSERRGPCASDSCHGLCHLWYGDTGGALYDRGGGRPTIRCAPYETYGTEDCLRRCWKR